ncbi:MAG: glutaminyl-peptide cyclotransferase [Acidobacteriota bacterium]
MQPIRIATLVLPLLLVMVLRVDARTVSYSVSAVLPHDQGAFTQGLLFWGGHLYESTGLHGRSSLRKVEPATGRVLRQVELDREDFGEGLALWGGQFYQLTWRNAKVHVYDADSLERVRTLPLHGEGWGVATTPFGLVTSDGSATLTWRDPATMRPTRTVGVTDAGRPVVRLNELEWVEGFILANIWHEDRIAVVSPATGQVAAWIDCAPLRARLGALSQDSDLNGIAWDPAAKKLYVTGKLWPAIFELALEGLPKP